MNIAFGALRARKHSSISVPRNPQQRVRRVRGKHAICRALLRSLYARYGDTNKLKSFTRHLEKRGRSKQLDRRVDQFPSPAELCLGQGLVDGLELRQLIYKVSHVVLRLQVGIRYACKQRGVQFRVHRKVLKYNAVFLVVSLLLLGSS